MLTQKHLPKQKREQQKMVILEISSWIYEEEKTTSKLSKK